MKKLGSITQTYSHFQLQAEVYLCEIDKAMNSEDWYERDAIARLPLSKADLKTLALLPVQP